MEKRARLIIALLLVAQLLVMAAAPVAAGEEAPAGTYQPESVTLDAEAMQEILTLGEQMEAYLTLNKDGTLSLGEVNTTALNASDEYLENYEAALGYVNAAIKQGLFTVDENLQVSWPEDMEAEVDAAAPKSAAPDWTGYPSSHGLYVNFGYNRVQHYLPRHGLTTALSLASYCRRPWISTPYTYHFTYYRMYRYYYRYSYNCCGIWSYVPWSSLGHYSGYYQPTYRYTYFWYPYTRYWNYYWSYW